MQFRCVVPEIFAFEVRHGLPNLVMWHSRVPALKANFGSCEWISTILGLLESPWWDEHNHPKTAYVRYFLPELGSFGCYESSEIFKFLFQESFIANSTLLSKWFWNQPILTVVVLPWILQVWCIEIHLWVTSWESYDKIHLCCNIELLCYFHQVGVINVVNRPDLSHPPWHFHPQGFCRCIPWSTLPSISFQ